jgi:PTH1 family peptidyl-tRNA hydrolase
MQLWVGLGNPGANYALNRHNVGFMAVDTIAEVYGFDAPKQRFKGWTQEGRVPGNNGTSHKILLLKPATFMNLSGESIRAALNFYKLESADVTVWHDELDLDPFRVKVKTGGGTAGHNGLKSAAAHIGEDFRRVRLGIGHPGHKDRVHNYVLSNYAKVEIEPLSDMLGAVAAEAGWLADGDAGRFMSDVAGRLFESK